VSAAQLDARADVAEEREFADKINASLDELKQAVADLRTQVANIGGEAVYR
jgi:hypothetical protein